MACFTYLHNKQDSKEANELSERYHWNLRGGTLTKHFLGVHRHNFTKLGEDIGRSWLHSRLFQCLDILLHFQTRVTQSEWFASDVDNNAKFCIFLPGVKIREGWARSLSQFWSFTYVRTSTAWLLSAVYW